MGGFSRHTFFVNMKALYLFAEEYEADNLSSCY